MSQPDTDDVRSGRATLEEHRRLWRAKPVLGEVYRPWFERLLAAIAPGAHVLEVGAGPGFLAETARQERPDLRWLGSDLIPAPWNGAAAEAGALPFRSGAFEALVGVDALHHMAAPRAFFEEAARVLRPGAPLLCLEPWITPLSFVVYRFFHQESCRLGLDPWRPFPSGDKVPFDGDAALPWRIVRDTTRDGWRELGFERPRRWRIGSIAYLLSLGFRERSLLPRALLRPVRALDRALAPAAPLLALRALLLWRRLELRPEELAE